MRKTARAQELLALFTSAECAEAIAGDLTEGRGDRGSIWFWRQVLATTVALWGDTFTRTPLASLGLAAAGGWLFASSALGGVAAVSLFPQHIGSAMSWIVLSSFWWGGALCTGASLVAVAQARGMAACVVLAITGEALLMALGLTVLQPEVLRTSSRLTEVVRETLSTVLAGGPRPEEKLYQAEFLNALVDSYDSRKAATLFESFTTNGTWQEPTFVALRNVWEQQRKQLSSLDAAAGDRVWTKTLEMFADMREHGVKVLAGSDVPVGSGVPPLHDELVALVRAGMTPLQALQAATRNAAEFQGRLATEGTVEVGKKANLVLLEADPLTDIANTRRVAAVVVGGRLVSESELKKIR